MATGRKNYNHWEINGEKGSIAFNLERTNEMEIYLTDDAQGLQGFHTIQATENFMPYMSAYWPVAHIIGYEHTFVNMVKDFLDAVGAGKPFSPDFQDGYRNQAVLDAVEKSANERAWKQVER